MPQALFCRLLLTDDRLNAPALPDSSVGFNPFRHIMAVPALKGLKPTKEEALPPVFYIRRLKTDGKREPAAQGLAL